MRVAAVRALLGLLRKADSLATQQQVIRTLVSVAQPAMPEVLDLDEFELIELCATDATVVRQVVAFFNGAGTSNGR